MKRVLKGFLIFLGILLVLVFSVPLIIPIPRLPDTKPVVQLADPDSRFIEINGINIHYKMAGQGQPVFVLLHGFAASLYSWQEVLPRFAEIGTVIAFDRPAFGLTERPVRWNGQNPYSPESQVEITIRLMDALGVEKAILVGNSSGGAVSMSTALAYPNRVGALILVDPAVYSGGGQQSILVHWLLQTPQARRIGPLFVRGIRDWGLEFGRSAWHDPSKITDEKWALYTKPLQAENWDIGLWEFTQASHWLNLPARLNEVKLPTLVITGDDDRIVPTEQSVRLAGELPNAQLVVVSECGHVPHEEKPAEYMQAVREFLVGLP